MDSVKKYVAMVLIAVMIYIVPLAVSIWTVIKMHQHNSQLLLMIVAFWFVFYATSFVGGLINNALDEVFNIFYTVDKFN